MDFLVTANTMNTSVAPSFANFVELFSSKTRHSNVMRLNLFVDGDAELKAKYLDAAAKHNSKLFNEYHFFDAGFDLFLPDTDTGRQRQFTSDSINKVDFQVRCCAEVFSTSTKISDNDNDKFYTGFYVYPRSSLSKTSLRLANCTGIIDAGYRGHLIGMFDCFDPQFCPELYDRLVQICAPNLMPIFVNVVDSMEQLGPNTSRGDGGFGSSGR
jgi:dUTP pyrophosphatase